MILFPNCKINIGLRVLNRRPDGYHAVETVMYPVPGLCDAVEVLKNNLPGVEFSASGLTIDGPAEKNLCVKAYEALRRRYAIGGVKIHLHKVVPAGAGLGGGSADAAFVIRGLSELFELNLPNREMESIAAEIGSDTAFFIENRPALATGRGEVLEPFALSLSGYTLAIVKPAFSVGTAEAYAGVVPHEDGRSLAELLQLPVAYWKEGVDNDFERSVFARHPLLNEIKTALYEQGATYAAMSGSGSAIYGLFASSVELLFNECELFVYQVDIP